MNVVKGAKLLLQSAIAPIICIEYSKLSFPQNM